MKARKLYNFADRNLDGQIKEICDSFILPDLGGSTRKWAIVGVQLVDGTDEAGNAIQIPQLVLKEL